MTTKRTTAVGVFTERAQAENALEALHRLGFHEDQLGFVTREGAVATSAAGEDLSPRETNVPTTAAGAVGGGVIGGVVGAAVALLIPGLGPALAGGILGGAVVGALAGGFAGSLVSMGVPEEEARYYQEQLAAGRTIVTVSNVSPERYSEAVTVMRQSGAYDATVKSDMPDLDNEGTPTMGVYNADRHPGDLPPVVLPPGGTTMSGAPIGGWPVPPASAEMTPGNTTSNEPTEDYASSAKKAPAGQTTTSAETSPQAGNALPDRPVTEPGVVEKEGEREQREHERAEYNPNIPGGAQH